MLSVEGNAALAVVTYIFAATMSWGILMKSTLPFLEKSKCSQKAKLFARDRLKNSHGLSASLPGVNNLHKNPISTRVGARLASVFVAFLGSTGLLSASQRFLPGSSGVVESPLLCRAASRTVWVDSQS